MAESKWLDASSAKKQESLLDRREWAIPVAGATVFSGVFVCSVTINIERLV